MLQFGTYYFTVSHKTQPFQNCCFLKNSACSIGINKVVNNRIPSKTRVNLY